MGIIMDITIFWMLSGCTCLHLAGSHSVLARCRWNSSVARVVVGHGSISMRCYSSYLISYHIFDTNSFSVMNDP
jgi:hypothetical protein